MFSSLPTLENLTKHCWKQHFLVCPGFNAGFFLWIAGPRSGTLQDVAED